jgi:phosphoadenosine phosphosulfate reductase
MDPLPQRIDSAASTLTWIATHHAPAVFASSFGAEDMVVLDLIARFAPAIGVFTLDTGRLPEETRTLIAHAAQHYQRSIDIYHPDAAALEKYTATHGINAFFESVALRQGCCNVRKAEPLRRALAGKGAWITGLRREQSVTRTDLQREEFDTTHGLPKFNPLVDWSEADVWAYVRDCGVPYNPLHDRGFRSIGCAPCTRAVAPDEDLRAGRWWWEQPEHKECGIHRRPAGIVARNAPAASL